LRITGPDRNPQVLTEHEERRPLGMGARELRLVATCHGRGSSRPDDRGVKLKSWKLSEEEAREVGDLFRWVAVGRPKFERVLDRWRRERTTQNHAIEPRLAARRINRYPQNSHD
jgi:hypothetical protein